MSILIKGAELSKHMEINGDNDSIFRGIIVVHKDGTAEFIVNLAGESTFARCNDSRLERFPCIDVPTPHGRLIDADALMECRLEPNHYEELKDGYIPDYDLDSAPTIIEAEVSE